MQLKLIQDRFNRPFWQWKYFETRRGFVNNWFDFGPPHKNKKSAIKWKESDKSNITCS